jgi:hypothetical protein
MPKGCSKNLAVPQKSPAPDNQARKAEIQPRKITIVSEPSGAAIYDDDGREIGQAPLTLAIVRAARLRIVSKTGQSKNVEIDPQQEANRVTVVFREHRSTRRSRSKRSLDDYNTLPFKIKPTEATSLPSSPPPDYEKVDSSEDESESDDEKEEPVAPQPVPEKPRRREGGDGRTEDILPY